MGYLEVEDRRARAYLRDEIISAIIRFSDNERLDNERFVSLDESGDYWAKKEIEQLSVIDDCALSFFEETSDNILDILECEDLMEAMKYLDESEINLLTKLFVKQEEEYEIALELNTSVKNIQFKKFKILEKIKENFKIWKL